MLIQQHSNEYKFYDIYVYFLEIRALLSELQDKIEKTDIKYNELFHHMNKVRENQLQGRHKGTNRKYCRLNDIINCDQ